MAFHRKCILKIFSILTVSLLLGPVQKVNGWTWAFWKAPPTSDSCTNDIPFADTDDCLSYYRCQCVNGAWNIIHSTCNPGSIWDDVNKVCIEGTCQTTATPPTPVTQTTEQSSQCLSSPTTEPSSQSSSSLTTEQSSQSSSSPNTQESTQSSQSSSSSTTSSQTESTTDQPPDTTTKQPPVVTPSTLSPPPPGRPCLMEGFFAEPSDCHRYYRCVLIGGRMYAYPFLCPFGSGFSSQIQRCVIGTCSL